MLSHSIRLQSSFLINFSRCDQAVSYIFCTDTVTKKMKPQKPLLSVGLCQALYSYTQIC